MNTWADGILLNPLGKSYNEMTNPGQNQLHLLVVPRGNTGLLGEMPVANGALDN